MAKKAKNPPAGTRSPATSSKRKPAAAAAPAKKASVRKPPAPKRKPAAAAAPAKKAPVRKPPAPKRKPAAAAAPAKKAPVRKPPAPKRKPAAGGPADRRPARRLTRPQMETFRKLLLNLRDSIVDEISFLTGETLNHNQRETSGDLSNYGLHMADQGTDNFDREFALNLASNEQDVLYEIDEALQRIDAGTYGLCEQSGEPIEVERLKVLPYARLSRAAQEELERRTKRRRPSGSYPAAPFEEDESQED